MVKWPKNEYFCIIFVLLKQVPTVCIQKFAEIWDNDTIWDMHNDLALFCALQNLTAIHASLIFRKKKESLIFRVNHNIYIKIQNSHHKKS